MSSGKEMVKSDEFDDLLALDDDIIEVEVIDDELSDNAALDRLEDAEPENVPWEGITVKQKAFCDEYLRNGYKQGAAWRAVSPGCAVGTGDVYAHRLLKKAKIKAYIEHRRHELEKVTGVSKARNMITLANIAYTDMGEVFQDWYEFHDFKSLPKPVRDAIKSIKITEGVNGRTVHIQLHDKVKAIEALNRLNGYEAPTQINVEAPVIFPNRPRKKLLNKPTGK